MPSRGSTFTLRSIYLLTFIVKYLKICFCLHLPYLVFSLRPFQPAFQYHSSTETPLVKVTSNSIKPNPVIGPEFILFYLSSWHNWLLPPSRNTFFTWLSDRHIFPVCLPPLQIFLFFPASNFVCASGSDLQPSLFPTAMTLTSPNFYLQPWLFPSHIQKSAWEAYLLR